MDMDVIGDQFAGDLWDGENSADGARLAVTESLHGVEGMRRLGDAVRGSSLHLFVTGSCMRRRDSDAALLTFLDQPEVLVIFRRQRQQTDDASIEKIQSFFSFRPADLADVLRAAAGGVEVRSLEVYAEKRCPTLDGTLHLFHQLERFYDRLAACRPGGSEE